MPAATNGYLPGDWNVEPNGAFTYHIPLEVPDGRAGMQPALALRYSSNSTETGILGVGWSLEGPSMITRCGQHLRQHDRADGVDFDETVEPSAERDRLCLDGSTLVQIDGAGGYGAPGGEYRTELDRFARITTKGSVTSGATEVPERYIVEEKSGLTREFIAVHGVPRIHGSPFAMPPKTATEAWSFSNAPVVDGWVLDRELDRSGNVISYEWSTPSSDPDALSGENGVTLRLDAIEYTAHADLRLPAERRVEFRYSPSADKSFLFRAGVRTELRWRLDRIVMHAPNVTSLATGTVTEPVWEYQLEYGDQGPHSGRQRLASVRRCGLMGGSAAGCTWKKELTWTDGPAIPVFTSLNRGSYDMSLVGFDLSNPYDPQSVLGGSPPTVVVLDLDGDGADDAVVQRTTPGGGSVTTDVLLGASMASGHTNPLASTSAVQGLPGDTLALPGARAIDLDGDGRDELIARTNYYNGSGGAWGTFAYRWNGSALVRDATNLGIGDPARLLFGDIDGDRLPEALYGASSPLSWDDVFLWYTGIYGDNHVNGQFWKLYRNVSGTLVLDSVTPYLTRCPARVADIDGDGRVEFELLYDRITNDAIEHYNPTDYESKQAWLKKTAALECANRGRIRQLDSGTLDIGTADYETPTAGMGTVQRRMLRDTTGDFNGDGLADSLVIRRDDDGTPAAAIRWHTGNGFGPEQAIADFFPPPIDDTWELGEVVGDFDGDGRDDVLLLRRLPLEFTDFDHPDLQEMSEEQMGHAILALSEGDGSFDLVNLSATAGLFVESSGLATTQAGDFNGDGFLDLIGFEPSDGEDKWHLRLMMQERHYGDRILTVRDEPTPWARERVRYDYRWSDHPEPTPACSYPLSCVDRGAVVVREVSSRAHQRDPILNTEGRSLLYSYEEAVADNLGRGFLGMRKFRIWDPTRPMEVVMEYDNRTLHGGKYFPRAPEPVRITTVIPFGERVRGGVMARVIRRDAEHVVAPGNGGKTYTIVPSEWTETEWEELVTVDDWGPLSPSNPTGEHIYDIDAPSALVTRSGSVSFDAYGNLTHVYEQTSGGASRELVTSYSNDTANWLIGLPTSSQTTATEPDAAHTTRGRGFEHDIRGRVTAIHEEPNAADAAVRSSRLLEYSDDGTIRRVVSVAGDPAKPAATRETRIEYAPVFPGQPDERIYPSQIWSPFDPIAWRPSIWLAMHPAYGVLQATMDANGVQSRVAHDALGRQVWAEADGAPVVTTTYTGRPDQGPLGGENGIVITSTSLGQQAIIETDGLLRPIRTTDTGFDGSLDHTDQRYDSLGRVTERSRPHAGALGTDFFHYAYDALDRLVVANTPLAESTQYRYTYFTAEVTDASGYVSGAERDVNGRLVRTWNDGLTGPIETFFEYAPFGLLRRVVDPEGNATERVHDVRGRVLEETDPTSGTSQSTYNGLGDLLSVLHKKSGSVSSYAYDSLGRIVAQFDADGATVLAWDSATNGIGRLAVATSPDGVTRAAEYDGVGRQTATELTVGGESFRVGLEYDAATGMLDAINYPSVSGDGTPGLTAHFTHNSAQFVDHVWYDAPGTPYRPLWTVFGRTMDDRLSSATYGNGATLAQSYDVLGRLQHVQADTAAQPLLDLSYAYHPNGLVSRRDDALEDRHERFDYDPLRRLTAWTLSMPGIGSSTTSYAYDAIGNIENVKRGGAIVELNSFLHPTQPYALTNRIENGKQLTYEYDSRGRQTSGADRVIEYTELDLPRTVTVDGKTTSFQYDAFGTRVLKESDASRTVYVEDLYERRSSDFATQHVFKIPGTDGDLGQVVYANGQYSVEYTVQDHLGSVALTMEGGTLDRLHFDPFGKRIEADGTDYVGPLGATHQGFTGHEHDDELGLINMRGRVYDPRLKRFLTMDPLVVDPTDGQSWNPYAYVSNSPLNFTDPSGFAKCIHTNGGGGTYISCTDGTGVKPPPYQPIITSPATMADFDHVPGEGSLANGRDLKRSANTFRSSNGQSDPLAPGSATRVLERLEREGSEGSAQPSQKAARGNLLAENPVAPVQDAIKKDAETDKIKAETDKIKAETEKLTNDEKNKKWAREGAMWAVDHAAEREIALEAIRQAIEALKEVRESLMQQLAAAKKSAPEVLVSGASMEELEAHEWAVQKVETFEALVESTQKGLQELGRQLKRQENAGKIDKIREDAAKARLDIYGRP